MYLWQRLAAPSWWVTNENEIRAEAGNDLAIIQRPGRKRLTLGISCHSRTRGKQLQQRFGGRVIQLRRGWLARFAKAHKTKPLLVGKRLVITNAAGTSVSRMSRHQGRSHIVIPAGAAFGTGQHPTTAMSLRLLEQITGSWEPGWSMVDVGTGSGIFALAAKRFGAGRVIGIDIDPMAISTSKANARLNGIGRVGFRLADVLKWRPPTGINLVTANLFSELLIAALPKLRRIPWLILSGLMRDQERQIRRALKQNRFRAVTIRRRGKWIAILARKT
jgi:ribosomal protein L11 methyltransferase